MVQQKNKLLTLLKTYEAAEYTALEQHQRVERVVEERAEKVEQLRKKEEQLNSLLRDLRGDTSQRAVLRGDGLSLSAIKSYEQRMLRESRSLANSLKEKSGDLQRATERAKLTEQELVDARVERKKVERLNATQQRAARVREIANEEASEDELKNQRGKD